MELLERERTGRIAALSLEVKPSESLAGGPLSALPWKPAPSPSPPRPPEDTRAIYDLRLWLAYSDGTGGALWTGFSPDLPSGKLEPTEDLFEAIGDRGVKPITQDGFVSSLAKGLELSSLPSRETSLAEADGW